MKVRVRYAPSPTGLQHVGSVRTALFNYFFAKSQGGTFVLRIEDTDRTRFHLHALEDIYEIFSWLGIQWDEGPDVGGDYGPYIQSERSDTYTVYAQKLISIGKAYISQEEHAGKSSHVVRLRLPSKEQRISFHDVLLGRITYSCKDLLQDPVLIKSDGNPTYHFANVVDDHLMCISHVMRSQEWIPSTPLHVILYQAFQWKTPIFCHLPLVLGADGQKLSKRNDAMNIRGLREVGYLPEALVNCIVLLGYAYNEKTTVLDRHILEKLFSLSSLNKSPSVFDPKKLDWFNNYYIQKLSDYQLLTLIQEQLERYDWHINQKKVEYLLSLLRPRLKRLADVRDLLRPLVQSPDVSGLSCTYPEIVKGIEKILLAHWQEDEQTLVAEFRDLAERYTLSLGACIMELRKAITGEKVSLPIFSLCKALGKKQTVQRIAHYMSMYEKQH